MTCAEKASPARFARAKPHSARPVGSGYGLAPCMRLAWLSLLGGLVACHYVLGDYEVVDDTGTSGGGTGGGAPDAATGGAGGVGTTNGTGGVATGGTSASGPAECTGSATRCEAQELMQCRDGSWKTVEFCSDGLFCDEAKAICSVCLRDMAYCDGSVLQTCNPQRTGWDSFTCDSGVCLDGTGTDTVAHCKDCDVAGTTKCTSEGNLQTCMSDFSWRATVCNFGCVSIDDATFRCADE